MNWASPPISILLSKEKEKRMSVLGKGCSKQHISTITASLSSAQVVCFLTNLFLLVIEITNVLLKWFLHSRKPQGLS